MSYERVIIIEGISFSTSHIHKGLSRREAAKRLKKSGPNILLAKKRKPPGRLLAEQFSDFMVIVLLLATAISAFMGEITEAVTIAAIVAVNALLGFIQEYKTEKTIEALRKMAAPLANVLREGSVYAIPASEVVCGDVILLGGGDRIPADGCLFESFSMGVNESILTGESVPAEKHVDSNVYMGTTVIRGKGKAVVTATGMDTGMGRIAHMISDVEDESTPLQKRLNNLGRYIVAGCIAVCAAVTLTGILRGEELISMLLAGISLAVAAVPEGLPAVVTISLAIGVQRMAKRKAVVRKLHAVETLGCADVICSDKTGTLTENKMAVRRIFAGGRLFDVEKSDFREMALGFFPLTQMLKVCALCNNCVRETTITGDPTEEALLYAASRAGIVDRCQGFIRTDETPFDADRKYMAVVCTSPEGGRYVYVKGAPDVIIAMCDFVETQAGQVKMNRQMSAGIMLRNDRMADKAMRVIAAAYKKADGHSDIESGLVFAGLAGMTDPPRKEARSAVERCRSAGIKPVMITGDHRLTACAVARELGMYLPGDRVLTGYDIDGMTGEELSALAESVSVYARVRPDHKLEIVKAIKRLGHTVAMTGDGVNDAPAVKEADIGIAMGKSGTDVTREASSMVLLDDNFATIVAAVEEGRTVYSNIRKFIRYLLSCNIGEILTMLGGMLLGLPIPLLPIQILWVNLVTDGLPAIALGLEPVDRQIMTRPPRDPRRNVFSDGLASLILFRGAVIGISTLAVFAAINRFTGNIALARTGGFITLVLAQLIHVFECKSEKRGLLRISLLNNLFLILAVLCSIVMMLAVVYLPFFQPVFRTVPPGPDEWLLIAAASLFGPAVSGFFHSSRNKGL